MSTTPTAAAPRPWWRGWADFWFRPTDPTTIGFIRIATGLLVLYVYLAYSFDLQAFFGKHGWYALALVDKERRELELAKSVQREDARKIRDRRRAHVGKLAQDAGLFIWEDSTLSALFVLLGTLRAGAAVEYRLRWRRLPLRWRTEITAWEPPRRFVDSQARGPYRRPVMTRHGGRQGSPGGPR